MRVTTRPASPSVQADFDALPFAPAQFDLVVFNGSLHYAADAAATLDAGAARARAGRRARRDGLADVRADGDGRRWSRDSCALRTDYGIADVVRPGVGFLTFARLAGIAEKLALRPQFVPSRGPLGWRLRRGVARVRLRRAPAAFGLWVAR